MSHIVLCIRLFSFPQSLMNKLLLFPFHRRESRGTEKRGNLPEDTHLQIMNLDFASILVLECTLLGSMLLNLISNISINDLS